jgi:hypothetical protein
LTKKKWYFRIPEKMRDDFDLDEIIMQQIFVGANIRTESLEIL